jgi:hypothetical protein
LCLRHWAAATASWDRRVAAIADHADRGAITELEDLDVDQSIRTLIEAIAGIAVGDRQEAVDVCAEAEVSEVAA